MHFRGIVYILLSSLTFSIVNVCVKYLSHLPTHELVFFRSLISLVICLVWIRQLKIPLLGYNRKWLLIRGVSGMVALYLFFATLRHMPLAAATTIQYLSPIFTVFLATRLLNEQVRIRQWIFMLCAFGGVVMIKGFDERISYFYLAVGVLSAAVSGLAYNAIMKCRDTDHPITVVTYFPLLATPLMGTFCVVDEWHTPQGLEWLILIAVGSLTLAAQYFMTKALHSDHSSRLMPFKYFGVAYALGLGYWIFDESIPAWSLLGMVLVIATVVANAMTKSLNRPLPGTQGVI